MPLCRGTHPQAAVEVFTAIVWVFPSVTWKLKATHIQWARNSQTGFQQTDTSTNVHEASQGEAVTFLQLPVSQPRSCSGPRLLSISGARKKAVEAAGSDKVHTSVMTRNTHWCVSTLLTHEK